MKRASFIFWMLYLLFFAIPFPALIYYNTRTDDIVFLKDQNPWLALSILTTSILLWFILLAGYFDKWVLNSFKSKRNIERLIVEGIRREAKILAATKLSKPEAPYDTYELCLSFKNLADSEITQIASVNDSKPYERRYEVGKKVDLLIDKDVKQVPYFIFASTKAKINKTVVSMIVLGWLLFFAVIIGCYIYVYQSESYGMGWRFIGFGHPLFVCPLVLLFYSVLGKFVTGKIGGESKDTPLIKFKGIRTDARIISTSQTGMYINTQPMIRFVLEYTDSQRQKRQNELKKIVDLLDLDIVKQETIEIFYVKDNPDLIAFAGDLDKIR